MGIGRFACMGVPFALTFASLVCILIVETGLITSKDYFFAKFETKNLSVSATSVISIVSSRGLTHLPLESRDDISDIANDAVSSISTATTGGINGLAHLTGEALGGSTTTSSAIAAASSILAGTNVTATDLGLADSYTVGLWSYCAQTNSSSGKVTQKCSKAKAEFWFDPFSIWNLNDTTAETAINSTTLNDALKTYKKASAWTWVLYLVAFIFTILELLLGVAAIFSRIGSCCTTIASNISSVAITLASILATVMWSILVESFNHELKKYGLTATVSTRMLAVTWLAVVFSLASGFFWMISICCCGSASGFSHKPKRTRDVDDSEKLIPRNGPYERIGGAAFAPTAYVPPTQQGYTQESYAGHEMTGGIAKPRAERDIGDSYEPYRHNNI